MTKPCLGPDPNPRPPKFQVPANACDCHSHVIAPQEVYPYVPERSYTPPPAPLEAYKQMHAVLVELQQASAYEQTARLWWLAAGLVEALLDRGLEVTNYTRQLLGHVDRQIKELIDAGETAFCDLVSEVLLKDMLFNLTRAGGSAGRVGEIRTAYDLDGPGSEAAREAAS